MDDYYDIGPRCYRFVENRHFGSRRFNNVFIDRSQNINIIRETTNITNITYEGDVIHNGGLRFDQQSRLRRSNPCIVINWIDVRSSNRPTLTIGRAFSFESQRGFVEHGGGINCFSMGRSWREPGLGEFQAHDGVPKMLRGAVGGSGKLGGSWSWDAYFQSGRTEYNTIRRFNRNELKFRNSMDAVDEGLLRSGLRNNNIVCRINADVSTANDDPACAPVYMFGFGSIAPAAIAYFTGTSRLDQWTWQSVGAATLRGEPFSIGWPGVGGHRRGIPPGNASRRWRSWPRPMAGTPAT